MESEAVLGSTNLVGVARLGRWQRNDTVTAPVRFCPIGTRAEKNATFCATKKFFVNAILGAPGMVHIYAVEEDQNTSPSPICGMTN